MFKMFKGIKVKEILKEHYKEILLMIGFSILLLIIDQATKWIAYNYLGPIRTIEGDGNTLPHQVGTSIEIIPGLLNFTLVTNNGAAFGMGSDTEWMRGIFILISWLVFILVPFYLYYYYVKYKKNVKVIYMIIGILIYGGNLGNLIDRTFYWDNPCGVIDFIDISPLIPGFGIFNLADAFVVIGVFIFLIVMIIELFKGDENSKEKEEVNKIKSDANTNNSEVIETKEVVDNDVSIDNEENKEVKTN